MATNYLSFSDKHGNLMTSNTNAIALVGIQGINSRHEFTEFSTQKPTTSLSTQCVTEDLEENTWSALVASSSPMSSSFT